MLQVNATRIKYNKKLQGGSRNYIKTTKYALPQHSPATIMALRHNGKAGRGPHCKKNNKCRVAPGPVKGTHQTRCRHANRVWPKVCEMASRRARSTTTAASQAPGHHRTWNQAPCKGRPVSTLTDDRICACPQCFRMCESPPLRASARNSVIAQQPRSATGAGVRQSIFHARSREGANEDAGF